MKSSRIAGALALVLLAVAARAQVVPEYDSFGPLGSDGGVAAVLRQSKPKGLSGRESEAPRG